MDHEIVRATLPDDYELITTIHNEAMPANELSAAEIQRHFESPPEKCLRQIFVAYTAGGEPAGTASYWQSAWSYAPHRFHVHVNVRPGFQSQGLGRALYDRVQAALAGHRPRTLLARIWENDAPGVRFVETRGYEVLDREWESEVDPAAVDLAPYGSLEEKLAAQGIQIKTLAELRDGDPRCARKIFELDWEATRDIPVATQFTKPSFEKYRDDLFGRPGRLPEAYFVAVDGNRYAGMTSLRAHPNRERELVTGFTGVARAYRRRGIALALKVRALTFARARGTRTVRTWNAEHNAPMLAINERLGFVKQPAWVTYKKEIGE